jgi:hypothetical protein
MRKVITWFFCCVIALRVYSAQEATIPLPLNALLPKIQAGMTTSQVVAVLSQSYKDVTFQMGNWSGSSGYIDYVLDARFGLQVASWTQGGKDVVHPVLRFYVQDRDLKTRTEIVIYSWGDQLPQAPDRK